MKFLAEGRGYSVEGCIERADVEKQKINMLNVQYAGTENYDISNYRYCTKETLLQFIAESESLFQEILDV
jgi:hypothetical protein